MTHSLRAAGVLLLAAAPLGAQQRVDSAPVPLDPVVVTATRLATPVSALAQPVTVLRGADLVAQGVTTVAQALDAVPASVLVQAGSFGSVASLFVRGGQSDYVKVLVDGVPVNQAGGAYDFANLMTNDVERIEIVRGPASVVYGSDAVTGVVQIFTRTGSGPGRADLSILGGTYNTRDWEGSLTGGSGVVHYSIAASHFTSAGVYAFNNQYANTPFSATLRMTPDSATDLALTVHYDNYTYHFPTDGAGVPVDSSQQTNGTGPTIGVRVGHHFSRSVETQLVVGFHSLDAGYNDLPDSANFYTLYNSADKERRVDVDLRTNLVAPVGIVTVGVAGDAEHDQASDLCQTASPSSDCSSPPTDQSRTNSAVYLQLSRPGPGLAFTGGVRVEDNERFGTYGTYRGGVAYPVARDTRVRVSVGTGFREPSFAENYSTGFSVGNPALKPEHSFSGELGVERTLARGRAAVEVTGFLQRFRDMIDYDPNAAPGAPNYTNIAGASADGLEISARATPGVVSVAASYTYLHTEVTSGGFDTTSGALLAQGQPLVRRPTNAGRLDLGYTPPGGVRVWLSVTYVGSRPDQDYSTFPATRVTLPAFGRVDVATRIPLVRSRGTAPELAATARVENLLDAAYDEIEGFPARRRTVFVGARLGVGY
ncbi:MAG TPA: TonB-dependent receptor [Gemmatimonadales bacterium]|nr:TonB-dependent receptor [Gemmatimonadales bacterium]